MTRNVDTARSCHLYRGTYPFHYPLPKIDNPMKWQEDVDNRIKFGLSEALKLHIIRKGDTVIAVQGWRGGQGYTNSLRVVVRMHMLTTDGSHFYGGIHSGRYVCGRLINWGRSGGSSPCRTRT